MIFNLFIQIPPKNLILIEIGWPRILGLLTLPRSPGVLCFSIYVYVLFVIRKIKLCLNEKLMY